MARKYKILIVEDEPELAQIFTLALKNAGFIIEGAANGLEAWKKIKEDKFDLVLLDLVMPEIDGYEVLERVRRDKSTKDILIYAWSNLTQQDEINKAKKLGANDYLIKSDFTPTKLAEKVRDILGVSPSSTKLTAR